MEDPLQKRLFGTGRAMQVIYTVLAQQEETQISKVINKVAILYFLATVSDTRDFV